ncbi:MAG: hypothetical protein ACJ74W_14140 [Pyrinomonadaceae bacterium]
MRRRMTLSLVLTLSMLFSLVGFAATTQGQPPPQRFSFDSGVVTPAADQVLRITLSPSTLPNGTAGDSAIRVRLRWMQYGAEGCSGMPPVCRHMVVSQGETPVQTLMANEALSLDVPGNGEGMRVIVESNKAARADFQIINTANGNVNAIWEEFLK